MYLKVKSNVENKIQHMKEVTFLSISQKVLRSRIQFNSKEEAKNG